MSTFAQLVADKIDDFVHLRRSLGFDYRSQAQTLQAFRRFVGEDGQVGPLSQALVLEFVCSCDVTANVRARRYGVLRRFAEYLAIFDPHTEALDPRALPRSRTVPPVRILDDHELGRLLAAARDGSSSRPLRAQTLHAIIGLLASTGLRSGEARRLDRQDVDLHGGVLHVRRSKFRKDRLVPFHSSTGDVLLAYANARTAIFPQPESPAFFLSLRGGRLSASGFAAGFNQARARADLDSGPPRPVRPHDLRHRFAVTRLVTWHREGVDVQARLPFLAAYLGHARYSETAYYVTGTAELLGLAADSAFGSEGGAP